MEKQLSTEESLPYFFKHVDMGLNQLGLNVSPEVQIYLANLLEKFSKSNEPNYKEPLTPQLLKSTQEARHLRERKLIDLGDKALFILGFFYDRVLVDGLTEYHQWVGKTAYGTLEKEHFQEMAESFDDLSAVIGGIRAEELSNEQVWDYLARWHATGDKHYQLLLQLRYSKTSDLSLLTTFNKN